MIALIIVVGVLFSVRNVQAQNDLFGDGFVPAVIQSSFKIPFYENSSGSTTAELLPDEKSTIQGKVILSNVSQNRGTKVEVQLVGLNKDQQYIAVFHKNGECEQEDGSVSNSINGAFYSNENGEANIEDVVKERRGRIKSISLKHTNNFRNVSCIKL